VATPVAYLADSPVLLVWGHAPTQVSRDGRRRVGCAVSGGVRKTGDDAAIRSGLSAGGKRRRGGRKLCRQPWRKRCAEWVDRLMQFPYPYGKTWSVDAASDTVTLHERFTFVPLTGKMAGTCFAPLSPMQAIAMENGFPMTLDRKLSDTGLITYCGPYQGVAGTEAYDLQVKGLGRYYQEDRQIKEPGQAPQERRLAQALAGRWRR